MKSPYQSLKEESFEANQEIPARALAIYTWGNVSAYDKDRGVFAIKPSGVPYDKMTVDDIVVVDLDCKKVEGSLNPSSDTPTHAELYKNFADIGGITHTHSPYATSWAQAGLSIPLLGTTHADHSPNCILCTQVIGKKATEDSYEKETGSLIVDTLLHPENAMPEIATKDFMARGDITNRNNQDSNDAHFNGKLLKTPLIPIENPMILVAGHGPFAWGATAAKSVYNAAVLEEIARMAWIAISLNPNFHKLPDYIVNKHYERKHGKNAYYGQK